MSTTRIRSTAPRLRQFDVRLDTIDIVSVRQRQVSEAADPFAARTVDDHPAGVKRRTWLVLRALRDDEQLAVRVGPTEQLAVRVGPKVMGAASQRLMSPAAKG